MNACNPPTASGSLNGTTMGFDSGSPYTGLTIEAVLCTLDDDVDAVTVTANTAAANVTTLQSDLAALTSSVVTLTGTQTLTNKSIDAGQLTGSVADARLSSAVVTLTGTQTLTNKSIDAGQLTGSVADARLSANIPLKNAANTFAAAQTISTGNLTLSSGVIDVTQGGNGGITLRGTTPRISANNFWSLRADTAGQLTLVHDTSTSSSTLQLGLSQTTAPAGIVRGAGGSGTNIAGGNLELIGGASTGTGTGGSLLFRTTAAGGTGSSANSPTTRMTINSAGQIILASIPTSSAGLPSGALYSNAGIIMIVP